MKAHFTKEKKLKKNPQITHCFTVWKKQMSNLKKKTEKGRRSTTAFTIHLQESGRWVQKEQSNQLQVPPTTTGISSFEFKQ